MMFYTHDKQYVIKQINQQQLQNFFKIAKPYHEFITKDGNEDSIIVKIVGIYSTIAKPDFIVAIMQNVLPDDKKLQQIYELQGPFDREVNFSISPLFYSWF